MAAAGLLVIRGLWLFISKDIVNEAMRRTKHSGFLTALALPGLIGTKDLVPGPGLGDLESRSEPLGGSETFPNSLCPL